MKKIVAGIVGAGAIAAGVLAGAGAASATPYGNVEQAQRGPFSSEWTCEQARTQMAKATTVGASCYGTPGKYYFTFMRQASR